MKIDAKWLDTHDWGLRSSDNGISFEGFKWKPIGKWTKAKDWSPTGKCGKGLHYVAPEGNGYIFDYSRIELIETRGERIVLGDKCKSPEARIVAIGAGIPAEAFERCWYKVAKDGEPISPKLDELWIVMSGHVTIDNQSGGNCYAYDNARITSNNQSGGNCYAYDNARITSNNQSGGGCYAYLNARITSNNQAGGNYWAHGNAHITSNNQSRGNCFAYDNARITSNNQSGGNCYAYDNARITSNNQSGGNCYADGNARITSNNQANGVCKAYNNAKVIIKNRKK